MPLPRLLSHTIDTASSIQEKVALPGIQQAFTQAAMFIYQ